jgi:hypothetical protein
VLELMVCWQHARKCRPPEVQLVAAVDVSAPPRRIFSPFTILLFLLSYISFLCAFYFPTGLWSVDSRFLVVFFDFMQVASYLSSFFFVRLRFDNLNSFVFPCLRFYLFLGHSA